MHFIRGKVAEVTDWALATTGNGLVLQVEDTLLGAVRRIPVDMVVLSVGLEPQADAEEVRRTVQHHLRRRRASSWSGTPSWRR